MACMCVFTFLILLSLVFPFETELDSYRILKDIVSTNTILKSTFITRSS